MIDATHLKARSTAASLQKEGVLSHFIGRTKGGLNSKPRAVTDGFGRPLLFFFTAGQAGDYQGPGTCSIACPKPRNCWNSGYDAEFFRNGLKDKGISPCIPPRKKLRNPPWHNKVLYEKRYRFENLFAKLRDWRRIATRCYRGAHAFFSAIWIAASVIFWL
ncbi:transposase [Ensifer adhaerens]|uniref:Transposase n=1 Tax=Ensifer adhaerens TaxID=106592 RepID=A0ACC5T1B8_ENSAD|nr:transposase [Ensifer adhaerens]MBP1874927.1 transposase [Ensifer adhaerens]